MRKLVVKGRVLVFSVNMYEKNPQRQQNYNVSKYSTTTDVNICHSRRITTMNKWFEDNGYDVKEIWNSIEVRLDYR